jgi:peptide/nickel transport system ATP-binding protein
VALLEASGLCVDFELGATAVPVLRNIAFSLDQGRVLGLVGESGAGKSMIAKTVAHMLPPRFSVSGGDISFRGQSLIHMPDEAKRALLGKDITFVPQEPLTGLNPVLTIGRQFFEHLARLEVPRAQRRLRAAAMLASVHLHDPEALLHRYAHQLSGGMCQRVLIAMAFAGDPKLVVADVTIQARIMRIIAEMRRQHGTAVILITHDLRLAAHTCDEIMVLYAGGVVEHGPARQVFAEPRHPYTRCLQLANPPLSGMRRELIALPEYMPGLSELGAIRGCRFASRCPARELQCEQTDPELIACAPGRRVACHFPDRTAGVVAQGAPRPARGPANEQRPLLRVHALTKRFAGRSSLFAPPAREVLAVSEVSFELRANEFVGIVGESGSGKSTVAKLLMGLERPSEGAISIDGENALGDDREARRRRVASLQMVFQDPQSALNPRRRVASIVTQPMEAGANRASWPARLERARQLLGDIGMPSDAALRYPAQLSGGQRQRVNIARALCAVPRVLVADEIVSGLDVSVQAQLLNLLLRLKRERDIAMLFISHDLTVVRYLCDRVLVMYRGAIVEAGPTEDVFERPRHEYTRSLLAAVPPDDLNSRWAALETEIDDALEESL